MDSTQTNPFDDTRYQFFALRNASGQFSIWPDFRDIPTGWKVMYGPEDREACLSYVETTWTDLRP
ncbi:MbtH family protein [Rhodobacteraceae bacterium B1Z28]|uniref:MbtH family protein n=1 Tax=Ruegeria haliotis TaxID=2747601 RepID=A0ABX2PT60_9RHOB|nr:MbtH family protein [Ruegeria haliotis]NVO57354.1 MbtH family protein [Ruegeria haliotis]